MYKIELIKGAGWDATVIETHAARDTIHIVDIERMALALLDKARRKPNAHAPMATVSSMRPAGSLRRATLDA
jgi:hypothetical protein